MPRRRRARVLDAPTDRARTGPEDPAEQAAALARLLSPAVARAQDTPEAELELTQGPARPPVENPPA